MFRRKVGEVGMTIHFDFAVRKNCWNFYDSYGEICVGCGCCSADPVVRAKARLDVCERWLQERLNFDDWLEGLEKLQRKNIASDIKYYKRRIRYYKKRLKELEGR